MSNQPQGILYASVGSHASLWRTRLSRDQRYRGMALIKFRVNPYDFGQEAYGLVNLKKVRAALDTITLEDENAVVKVPIALESSWYDPDYPSFIIFTRANSGDCVRMKMPCGERRIYRVTTIDRALTSLGY